MKKAKIFFLILHYKVVEETINCVESILSNYSNDNIEVVIVDNGSNNGTGELLNSKYNDNDNVHIIINKENLGFSKGNNIGFEFAKKQGAKFIVMANNDIVFKQKSFCNLIRSEYEKYNYSVLGPKIIMPSNTPATFNTKIRTIKQQRIYLFFQCVRLVLAYLYLERVFSFFHKLKLKKKSATINPNEVKKNVNLYGCCMIFSNNYIEKFNGLDDRTFLYCEEDLLYLRLKKNNMLELYDPNLEVFHNHSVATKASFKSNRKKVIFVTKNLIKSNIILLKEMKEQ